ncbi:hypothetical protein MKW94_008684 [Papaver nudicaule]|uniref:WRKY domain-containing protein n=1 Tax=Papaver nudicaule TaxID=74823 RepID=A0AA41SA54_PAPNU|nr:hypothetical protein [Papaver nudicaule]
MTEKVRVCEKTGLEGPQDDGYSWRKYGQKDILGAKYPRGYYKCTFQKTQGCSALKQVQRTELDSSIFNVTYIGRHSCVEGSDSSPGKPLPIKPEAAQLSETSISFQTSCYNQVVKEEKELGNRKELDSFPSVKVENCFFETTSTDSSSTYISIPTTSESNYKFEGNSGEHNSSSNSADSHDSKIILSPLAHVNSAVDDYPMALDSCWDWDFLVDYNPPNFI